MKTKRFIPVVLMGLTFILISCSPTAAVVSTSTPIAPLQTPSPTPLPDVTVTPTPTPPPASLETLPPAATDTPAPGGTGTVDVAILAFGFDPPNINIKVGTTVRWINQDSVNHSIISDTGLWDSGGIAQGESYTRVFDTVGVLTYYFGIHSSIKGTISVTS